MQYIILVQIIKLETGTVYRQGRIKQRVIEQFGKMCQARVGCLTRAQPPTDIIL